MSDRHPLQPLIDAGRIVAVEGPMTVGWRGEPVPGAYYKIMIRSDFDRTALWRDLQRDIQMVLKKNDVFKFFDAESGLAIEP